MSAMPVYLSTGKMAERIGKSKDYLKRRKQQGVFVEGVHYFCPEGDHDPFWKVSVMDDWVEGVSANNSEIADAILDMVV